MKVNVKKLIVMPLAILAVIIFPLGIINFIAAESALTQVVLHDGEDTHEFLVGAETVGGFFHEAGIPTGTYDRISHAMDAQIWDGIEITLEREISFYVQKDGGDLMPRTARPRTTVYDVLGRLQRETDTALIYRGYDAAAIENGDVLNFDTLYNRLELELVSLPYQTIENHTDSVSSGMERLRNKGVEGTKAITTSIVYIAGIEDSREVVDTQVITEPVDAILDIGTGWLGALADVNASDFHYFRRVRMEATAYTAGYCCTGKHPDDPWYGITASGRRVQHGIVAVDRNVIPLGTRLYVENYGFAIAADVGGAIRGYKIDLFMYDLADAIQFGRRHIYVWILDDI